MKRSEIHIGKTYRNRGKGTTVRTVLAIGDEHRPKYWLGAPENKPNEPGVLFDQDNANIDRVYLSSFANWAGSQVMMADDEMVERLSNDSNERVHGRSLSCELDYNQIVTRKFWKSNINAIRSAGFEVIDKEELDALRANKVPPGWVCVDPEGEIDMDAEDAADAKVYITPGARYLDNTDDVIRAYLRAVRDMKEPGE